MEMADIDNPFLDEITRNIVDRKAEKVFQLRGKDGQGNTAGESHDDRVRDVFDDGSQVKQSQ